MKYPWSSLTGFPKMLVISTAVFLVSAGLCGLQIAVSSATNSSALTSILIIPGIFELIGFWGGAICIVISLVGWMITAIHRSSIDSRAEPPSITGKSDEDSNGKL